MTMLKDRPRSAGAGRPKPRMIGRLVAFLLLVVACWATLLGTTPSPSGEPVLRSTSPGSAAIAESSQQVSLTFDRPVPAELATIRVVDPSGEQIVFDRPSHPDGRAETISVPMPKQRYGGTYTVAWALPSSQLEPIAGTFSFDVAETTEQAGVPEIETGHDPVVTAVHSATRIAAVAALALLVGAVFFVAAIWPDGVRSKSVRRLVKYSWLGLVLATVGVLVSFGPFASWAPFSGAFDPGLLRGTLDTDIGGALLGRLGVLAVATLGIVQLMTGPSAETTRERWSRGATVLGCGAALAATWSFAHPRRPGSPTPLELAVDVALLLSVAVSVAGLGMLLLLLRGNDRFAPLAVVPRFSRVAVTCVGVFVVVGGYQTWLHAGDFGSLIISYGWLLAGMLALAALLVVSIVLGRSWVKRQLSALKPEGAGETGGSTKKRGPGRSELGAFRRLVAGATGIAGLIAVGTSVLAVTQAPQTAHAQDSGAVPPAIRQQAPPIRFEFDTGAPNGKGSGDVVVIPATTGQNGVHFDMYLTILGQNGVAKDDMQVTAVLGRPDNPSAEPVPVRLDRAGPGYSVGSATTPSRGRWELAVKLRAPDGSEQLMSQPIDVR